MEKLIEAGADIDAVDSAEGNSPLLWAVKIASTDIVRLLIQKNATVNLANKSGTTPLHEASKGIIIKFSSNIFDCTIFTYSGNNF